MTEEEKKIIFLIAQKLTGAHPDGTFRHEIFVTNIEERMRQNRMSSLTEYLTFAKDNAEENAHLISTLTIHTTSWFRENPHYVILQRILLNRPDKQLPYRMWSSACSTGEEVYSFAVLFEEFREFHKHFNYSILGTDIDPISLRVATRAVYDKKHFTGPLSFYKKHVLLGSGKTENYFTFTKSIRERCKFYAHDIRNRLTNHEPFDLIVCRNVLIYFTASEVDKVVQDLIAHLRPGGHLILGHSEIINYEKLGLTLTGHAVYQKNDGKKTSQPSKPTPVSTPKAQTEDAPKILKKISRSFTPELILIGASTGGPQAVTAALSHLNEHSPPVIVVQHIAPQFAHGFAKNLSDSIGLKLGVIADKEKLKHGHLYVAEGNTHIGVEQLDDGFMLRCIDKPPMNGHRPSVDFLFLSAIPLADGCIAMLLSGMGHDGARGLEDLHNHGAYTIAQSEADCAIYGMPKEAIDRHAVDYIGTSEQIGNLLKEITLPKIF